MDADAIEFGVELEAQAELRPVDDMDEVVVFSESCTELGGGSAADGVVVGAGGVEALVEGEVLFSTVFLTSSQNSSVCFSLGSQLPTVSYISR